MEMVTGMGHPWHKGLKMDTKKPDLFSNGNADSQIRQRVEPYPFSKALLHEEHQWKDRETETERES